MKKERLCSERVSKLTRVTQRWRCRTEKPVVGHDSSWRVLSVRTHRTSQKSHADSNRMFSPLYQAWKTKENEAEISVTMYCNSHNVHFTSGKGETTTKKVMFLLCLLWHVCELPSRDFKAAWLWGSAFLLETICAFMNVRGGFWAAEGWIRNSALVLSDRRQTWEGRGVGSEVQNYSLSPVNTSNLYRNKATAKSFSLCSENISLLSVHRLHAKLCPESWPLLGMLTCLVSLETQILDSVLSSSEELSRAPSLHVPASGLYHSSL